MARSAMLVLASRLEGFAIVLFEALACGCPGGLAEVLDHNRDERLAAFDQPVGMGAVIEDILDAPPNTTLLETRPSEFAVEKLMNQYKATDHRIVRSAEYGSANGSRVVQW